MMVKKAEPGNHLVSVRRAGGGYDGGNAVTGCVLLLLELDNDDDIIGLGEKSGRLSGGVHVVLLAHTQNR